MEHIVQFAIGIDDDAIKQRILDTAEKQIMESITKDVKERIFDRDPWSGKLYDNRLSDYVKNTINKMLETCKEDIIKAAADNLADRLMRTKKCKEAVDGVIKNLED